MSENEYSVKWFKEFFEKHKEEGIVLFDWLSDQLNHIDCELQNENIIGAREHIEDITRLAKRFLR